jgi:hypothetical protein
VAPGLSADHGYLEFPDSRTKAQFVTVADTTPPSLLVPFLVKSWRLHAPEIIFSVRSSHLPTHVLTLALLLYQGRTAATRPL